MWSENAVSLCSETSVVQPQHSSTVILIFFLHSFSFKQEIKAEDGQSVGDSASGFKVYSEVNGPSVCGEEDDDDGDAAEGFLSEPEGEMELEPVASESEDGYSLHTASSSLQLHTTADSIPSSPASSQL